MVSLIFILAIAIINNKNKKDEPVNNTGSTTIPEHKCKKPKCKKCGENFQINLKLKGEYLCPSCYIKEHPEEDYE